MISKTKMKDRSQKKTKPSTKATIAAALKNENWHKLAQILSAGTREYSSKNLFQIDEANDGNTIVIPGKVLSTGSLTKKVTIAALSISPAAKEKLKETKSEFILLKDEIEKNKKAEKITIFR